MKTYNQFIFDIQEAYMEIYQIDEAWKPVDESVCYTDECKKLGGEMRLCAPWVSECK
jgi:hypothetical protein